MRWSSLEEKLVLYIEIKQLKERGLNPSQIARQLKISRPTVYEYLSMSYEEAQAKSFLSRWVSWCIY